MACSIMRRRGLTCLLAAVLILAACGLAWASGAITLDVPDSAVPGARVDGRGTLTGEQVSGVPVGITIKDPAGAVRFVDEIRTGSGGTFGFTFTLPADASRGNWQVQVAGGGAAAQKTFSVGGAAGVISVSPSSVRPGNSVTFSGKVPQNNVPVGITVRDPNGSVAFVDETRSAADGSYRFIFTVPAAAATGTWTVDLAGGGTTGRATFTVSATTGGTGGTGSGGGAPPSPKPAEPAPPAPGEVKEVVQEGRETRLTVAGGKLVVVLPPGAVPAGATVTVKTIENSQVENFNLNQLVAGFARGLLGVCRIEAVDAQGRSLTSSGKPFTVTFKLAPAGNQTAFSFGDGPPAALVASAGSLTALNPAAVGGYYLDPVYGLLVPVPTDYNQTAGEGKLTVKYFHPYALVEEQPKAFPDVPAGAWYEKAVKRMAQKNLMGGFPDGRFRPDEDLTRAQAAKIITIGAQVPGRREAARFADAAGHWAETHINSAAASAVIGGYPDGVFLPERPVTRAELISMLLRALGEKAGTAQGAFTDLAPGHWAAGVINRAVQLGVAGGYPDGTFRPDAPVTRAEAASMLSRALHL